ncbi:MAG: diguanylate cyclase [Marinospirillum sp.]|uniref:diguanylate cyclase domain-containing protein n=1 Tax=Marinospirillum sp. TaxID=2183934 RepID=UPI001A0B39BF|nr:diguanylate cyclase [Marinospirillum sp.]MBE0508455.1 diguanylate cyclase [Marinospirillum sp.]
MKILLADDSRTTSGPVKAFLAQRGHQVQHVLDGRAAVDAYRHEKPDFILMDNIMPEMDGIEATRIIREMDQQTWVPIIMMTALESKDAMLKGLEAGADDYLFKPIDFDILGARIQAFERIAILQQSLSGVLDNVYEAIITISQTGHIQKFNKAAEVIFGYSAAEMLGQKVNSLMPSHHAEKHDGYLTNYLETQQPKIMGIGRKVQGRRKSGELFPMRLAVTEVKRAKDSLFIGLVQDISAEEAARIRIEYLALHDALTGLPNRAAFNQMLDNFQQQPSSLPHLLLFIDLDGFKPINDTLGHEAGDEALIKVAQRINKLLGKNDFAARLGGDEFVLLLHQRGQQQAAEDFARQLLDLLSQPMQLTAKTASMGASIGALPFMPDTQSNSELLTRADHAMYAAKRDGKGRVNFFNADVSTQ